MTFLQIHEKHKYFGNSVFIVYHIEKEICVWEEEERWVRYGGIANDNIIAHGGHSCTVKTVLRQVAWAHSAQEPSRP